MDAIINFFTGELLTAISYTILHSIWEGMVICTLVFVSLLMVRRTDAKTRYAIIGAGLLLLLASTVATFVILYDPDPTLIGPVEGHGVMTSYSNDPGSQQTFSGLQAFSWNQSISEIFHRYSPWLSLGWFMGAMIFILRSFGGILYVQSIKARSVTIDEGHWNRVLAKLAGRVGVGQKIRLAESAHTGSPVLVGYLKPVIIMPLGLIAGLTTDQVEAILVHELMHIRRKDYLINILQSFAEAILFFNPAVWWLSSQLRIEREHICDDVATSIATQPIQYARALAMVEEKRLVYSMAATSLGGQKRHLLNRIQRMMNMKKSTNHSKEGITMAIITFLAVFMLSAGAAITYSDYMNMPESALKMDEPAVAPYHESSSTEAALPATEEEVTSVVAAIRVPAGDTLKKERELTEEEKEKVRKAVEQVKEMEEEKLRDVERYMQEYQLRWQEHEARLQEQLMEIQEKMNDARFDTAFVYIHNGDTVYSSRYWQGTYPSIPEIGDLPEFYFEMPEIDFDLAEMEFEFETGQMEEAMKAYEEAMKDVNEMRKKDMHIYRYHFQPDGKEHRPEYEYRYEGPSFRHFDETDRIMRQELLSDGLIKHGKDYVVELNDSEMLINGEKQSRSMQKKYERLYESLNEDEPVKYKHIF